ncbi:MAG: GNAT family N-acetyltransferase [Limimaricola sp.]|uniref:GNAT family N-acetyltransferase n=1 Tax=Limimaricola sp. TaxID=2211665 RepID=UPI001D2AA8C2|nr:N-acetyltransferase [Limimaricola sp.]MBI1416316.1 GNAT family N-acetyltransferase [Limimaricola sp.]
MKITTGHAAREQAIVDLVTATFTASDGEAEGQLVGTLARDLLADTPHDDIRVFCAEDEGAVIAAAIFSRLVYPQDTRVVFLLSPMAVATPFQRQGVGQALLTHALDALRAEGVEVALTYGDPNYYRKVGFRPITEEQARAPMPLGMPHGWIGQSLTDAPMPALNGPSRGVPALNKPDIW